MLTLHHLEYSQSFRILWLLEELGADYELKVYQRDAKTSLAPDAYKAISPLGSAPVITDGDFALAESNAIIDYVMDRHSGSPLRPAPGDPGRERFLFWFHASQGSLMPLLLMNTVHTSLTTRSPFIARPVLKTAFKTLDLAFLMPRIKRLIQLIEDDLSNGPWFAGETFTVADISMAYSMEACEQKGWLNKRHPSALRWLAASRERAGYISALEKDGTGQVIFQVK